VHLCDNLSDKPVSKCEFGHKHHRKFRLSETRAPWRRCICGSQCHFSQLRFGDDMKTSTSREFLDSISSTLSFSSLTQPELQSSLLSFYLALDFDGRRSRFCCAVSDDAIKQHCSRLDLEHSIVLACSGPTGLLAAIELHPLLPGWEAAELAIAECTRTDRTIIISNLLQLAAFAAVRKGCATFVIPSYSSGQALLKLLRGMGRVLVQGDTVRIELDGYAGPYNH
jgi:hypothetical protein